MASRKLVVPNKAKMNQQHPFHVPGPSKLSKIMAILVSGGLAISIIIGWQELTYWWELLVLAKNLMQVWISWEIPALSPTPGTIDARIKQWVGGLIVAILLPLWVWCWWVYWPEESTPFPYVSNIKDDVYEISGLEGRGVGEVLRHLDSHVYLIIHVKDNYAYAIMLAGFPDEVEKGQPLIFVANLYYVRDGRNYSLPVLRPQDWYADWQDVVYKERPPWTIKYVRRPYGPLPSINSDRGYISLSPLSVMTPTEIPHMAVSL